MFTRRTHEPELDCAPWRAEPVSPVSQAAGRQRSGGREAVHQPRAVVAGVQRARAGGGARSVGAAGRAAEVPRIVASNLDEFFMVRVAGLKQQLSGNVAETPPDGLTAAEQLAAISARAHAHGRRSCTAPGATTSSRGWRSAGVRLLDAGRARRPSRRRTCPRYFTREVWPVLTPLAVDPGHPFPLLRNRSLNLAVFMHREKEKVAPARDDGRGRPGAVGAAAVHRGAAARRGGGGNVAARRHAPASRSCCSRT